MALLAVGRKTPGDVIRGLRRFELVLVAGEAICVRAGEAAAEPLDRIGCEADRLDDLIGQLLLLERLEAGSADQERVVLDVDELVAEVVSDASFEAAAKDRGFVYVARQVDSSIGDQIASLGLAGVNVDREDRIAPDEEERLAVPAPGGGPPALVRHTPAAVKGVEVGGAVKNVLAIGAGMSDGLGFGANARVALINRGLVEMTRLGVALGARKETFMGLAGMGDLVLTCTDNLSRNRRMGLALASGKSIAEAQEEIQQVVEGVTAAEAVHEVAEELGKPVVEIAGVGQATDTHTLQERDDPTDLKAVTIAAEKAFKMAGIKPKDIDVAELHDAFTILEIAESENAGFFEKGEGAKALARGDTRIGGKLPINPSGGLKARGHPVGATGVAHPRL